MVFFSPFSTSCLLHCPMQGPQALASTVPPRADKGLSCQGGRKQAVSYSTSTAAPPFPPAAPPFLLQHRPLTNPSLSIVALICSDPGVTTNCDLGGRDQTGIVKPSPPPTYSTHTDLALTPFSRACLAMLAARVMSSYELLVQLPISAGGGQICSLSLSLSHTHTHTHTQAHTTEAQRGPIML